MPEFSHIPVLANEAIEALNINPKGTYADMTCGGAGHSILIAQKLSGGKLVCFDQDSEAIAASKQRLQDFDFVMFHNANFSQAKSLCSQTKFDGILADLGVSSYQLDNADRGFSFLHDGKLDMRMDQSQRLSAFDVVNSYSEGELKRIIYSFGEEPFAPKIAHAITESRKSGAIQTTAQLKEIIESVFPKKIIYGKGGVSKRTFQAIRIEVNKELEILEQSLRDFVDMLAPGGRLAVISFHSLEDRIVKNVMKDLATDCICPPKTPVCICNHHAVGKIITKKPIVPTAAEIARNERSRSAKLRVFEKF